MTTVLTPLSGLEAEHPVSSPTDEPPAGVERRHLRGGLGRVLRGRPEDPIWLRPGLILLLSASAVAYLWALGDSGWANSFYSAAVQAGTKSWKAFFFGSSDASNFITVDKPPASLWVMELSARVFGLNSWSILVPQALEGVAAVGIVYAAVRRWFSPGAALLSGAVLALSPVAALMFRYNNPDALLVLLLTAACYATLRALERASTWWLVAAMALVGTGFITKMLQAFLVLPAIGLVYLWWAPTPLARRIRQLLVAGVTLVVAAGWWVVAVQLTPAADRPYIGGSQDNSLWNLIFGYNGFGRISGSESGSVGGAGAAGSVWGPTGWNRLFLEAFGGQVSWLIPGALIAAGACLWLGRRAGRADRTRVALALWGGVFLVTAVTISFAKGIIHPYYTIALVPSLGVLCGISVAQLWSQRRVPAARVALAGSLAVTVVWSFVLWGRAPGWFPTLRWSVLLVGLLGAAGLSVAHRLRGRPAIVLGALALVSALGGTAAWTLDTVLTAHSGAIPSAGPALASATGPGAGGFRGATPLGRGPTTAGPSASGPFPSGAGQAPTGAAKVPTGAGQVGRGTGSGALTTPPSGGAPGAGPGLARRTGAGGGFLNASTPGKALVALLEHDAGSYRWVAAIVNSNSAAGYQLATGDPVMAIGGFNGTDPAPSLAQFERYVAKGEVHYFIASEGGLGTGGTGTTATQITGWVEAHFKARTLDGVTIYDLAAR